jgi:ABC-type Na+ efflux pump permease subunit
MPSKLRWLGLQHLAALAAGLCGLVLTLVPAGMAAATLAAERQRGTLEALLLTPTHHRLLIRGRFWFAIMPWLRFAFYALPVYLAVSLAGVWARHSDFMLDSHMLAFGAAPWSIGWLDCLGRALVTHTWEATTSVWHVTTVDAAKPMGFLLSLFRWANDVSSALFGAAVALAVSCRAASVRNAVLASWGLALALLLTLLSADFWWVLVCMRRTVSDVDVYAKLYWIVVLAVIAVRVVLAFMLVGRVADNFDAYALGEELEKQRPATRRRRSV